MAYKTLVALAAALAAACGSSKPRTLHLSLAGVKPLANGFAYEGWAIIGGQPASTGRFNVDATGALVTTAGAPVAGGDFTTGLDLSMASAIVLTIEPAGKPPGPPSDTHFLAGPVASGAASLSVANAAALQNDFTGAKGKYVLAAPTDTGTGHQKSGVWFIDLTGGSPAAGLTLPALPAGWKYEGWAVIGGQPVTTGKFRSASGADEAAPYSGRDGAAVPRRGLPQERAGRPRVSDRSLGADGGDHHRARPGRQPGSVPRAQASRRNGCDGGRRPPDLRARQPRGGIPHRDGHDQMTRGRASGPVGFFAVRAGDGGCRGENALGEPGGPRSRRVLPAGDGRVAGDPQPARAGNPARVV